MPSDRLRYCAQCLCVCVFSCYCCCSFQGGGTCCERDCSLSGSIPWSPEKDGSPGGKLCGTSGNSRGKGFLVCWQACIEGWSQYCEVWLQKQTVFHNILSFILRSQSRYTCRPSCFTWFIPRLCSSCQKFTWIAGAKRSTLGQHLLFLVFLWQVCSENWHTHGRHRCVVMMPSLCASIGKLRSGSLNIIRFVPQGNAD